MRNSIHAHTSPPSPRFWRSVTTASIASRLKSGIAAGFWFCALLFFAQSSFSQNIMPGQEAQGLLRQLQSSVSGLTREAKAMEQKASAALPKLEQRQQKLQALLSDSLNAATADLQQQWQEKTEAFKSLLAKPDSLLAKMPLGAYNSRIDSLTGMLRFLADQSSQYAPACNELLQQVQAAQGLLAGTEQYANFLDTYRDQLGQALSLQGLLDKTLPPAWKKFSAQAADIKAQVAAWKETLNDPQKLEQMALAALRKTRWFEQFMQQNGELARLFGSVGGSPAGSPATALPGLQTTQSMGQLLTERFGSSEQAMAALQEQVQKGVDELQQLQQKLHEAKEATEELKELFDKKQKERAALKAQPFKQRLEKGWNFQQTPGRYGFPATNDLGLSLGYQFSRKGTLGIGAAYRFGLGSWEKIALTHEGIGLRTYLDWQIKNSWFITGAAEWNYWERMDSLSTLLALPWQKSGLVGVTRKIKMPKGEMKIQLMIDLMAISNGQQERFWSFRVGKNF